MASVVTDNAKKMEVMRNNLCEANHTMSAYGCSVLLLILLGKYITPPAIMVQVVNKYYRIHHDPWAFLSAISGSVKQKLPTDTKRHSQMTAIDTFLKNNPFMIQSLGQNEDEIDKRMSNLHAVQNISLYIEVKSLQTAYTYRQCTELRSIWWQLPCWFIRKLAQPAVKWWPSTPPWCDNKVVREGHDNFTLSCQCSAPSEPGSEALFVPFGKGPRLCDGVQPRCPARSAKLHI